MVTADDGNGAQKRGRKKLFQRLPKSSSHSWVNFVSSNVKAFLFSINMTVVLAENTTDTYMPIPSTFSPPEGD